MIGQESRRLARICLWVVPTVLRGDYFSYPVDAGVLLARDGTRRTTTSTSFT